jgi:hypothetical protein
MLKNASQPVTPAPYQVRGKLQRESRCLEIAGSLLEFIQMKFGAGMNSNEFYGIEMTFSAAC